MKLYYSPGACSLAVHIALHEVGAEFGLERVHLPEKQLSDGSDYLRISSQGYVPVLEFDDGSRYTETAALLQWIAESYPNRRLLGGDDARRRMDVLRWLAFVATELHKSFSPWLWHADVAESTRAMARAKLKDRFAEMEATLRRQEYLAQTFSVADAYAYTVMSWAVYLKLPLEDFPAIRAYLKRVAQRPAVMRAMRDEGLKK